MAGTNYYTPTINPNVFVKFTNENNLVDDAELRGTLVLPTDTNLFSKGCTLKLENNGTEFMNTAADALAPSWTQLGAAIPSLTSAHIFVGNAGNVATDVAITGDLTMTNAGLATVVGLQNNTVLASTPNIGGALIYDGTFWGSNPVQSLLFTLIGADMNSTADQTMIGPVISGTAFVITDIIFKNASVNLNTADGAQFWSGAAQTGSMFNTVGAGQLNVLTTNTKYFSAAQHGGFGSDVAGTSVIFSLQVAQGAPATADILVYGYCLA